MSDVSDTGLCVTLRENQKVGDVVRVEFADGVLFGQVVHVTQLGSGFRTGIEAFDVLLGAGSGPLPAWCPAKTVQAGGALMRNLP